jgi:hypothetical protein
MSEESKQPPKSKQVEEAERIHKIFEDTQKQLQTDPRMVDYLKNFDEKSVLGFIKYYAEQKAMWFKSGGNLARFRQHMKTHYYTQALAMFREIYHKKLFNVMCRWVAGEFDLPGIELSTDFFPLINNPGLCTFVEPITPEEYECYWQFRQTGNWLPWERGVEENDHSNLEDDYVGSYHAVEWYHQSRSRYMPLEKRDMPPWFLYYDKQFGTSDLLNLPHLRTDLELQYKEIWDLEIYSKTLTPEQLKNYLDYYRTLATRKLHFENPDISKAFWDEHNREYEEKRKNEPKYEFICTYHRNVMDELVPLLENREVLKYYRADVEYRRRQQGGEEIEMDVIYLEKAKEVIPIKSNDDYREAIKEANNAYSKRVTLELLPHVFENYRKCIQQGKPFDWLNGETPDKITEELRSQILQARKWKGEPENFDFLKKQNLPQQGII